MAFSLKILFTPNQFCFFRGLFCAHHLIWLLFKSALMTIIHFHLEGPLSIILYDFSNEAEFLMRFLKEKRTIFERKKRKRTLLQVFSFFLPLYSTLFYMIVTEFLSFFLTFKNNLIFFEFLKYFRNMISNLKFSFMKPLQKNIIKSKRLFE